MNTQKPSTLHSSGPNQLTITLLRLMTVTHVALYRWTGGWFGGHIAGNPVLLLTTIGRKTGVARTRPLLYLADGERMVVVGSAGTDARHPFWWLNLQANGHGSVQVRRTTTTVTATLASDEERTRLWAQLTQAFPRFTAMQQQTTRQLPVVVLHPVAASQ